jgi:hypothetical protein
MKARGSYRTVPEGEDLSVCSGANAMELVSRKRQLLEAVTSRWWRDSRLGILSASYSELKIVRELASLQSSCLPRSRRLHAIAVSPRKIWPCDSRMCPGWKAVQKKCCLTRVDGSARNLYSCAMIHSSFQNENTPWRRKSRASQFRARQMSAVRAEVSPSKLHRKTDFRADPCGQTLPKATNSSLMCKWDAWCNQNIHNEWLFRCVYGNLVSRFCKALRHTMTAQNMLSDEKRSTAFCIE